MRPVPRPKATIVPELGINRRCDGYCTCKTPGYDRRERQCGYEFAGGFATIDTAECRGVLAMKITLSQRVDIPCPSTAGSSGYVRAARCKNGETVV